MTTQFEVYYPFSRCLKIQNDFAKYVKETPNKKHISIDEKFRLIQWLINPLAKPSCQKDYSRRNYAQKTYKWDEARQILWAVAKNEKGKDRIVITEDEILQIVEKVHMVKEHGGWDATWEEVSRQYCGIVRSDIIFLLKRCDICLSNPRKRSKGTHPPTTATATAPAPALSFPTPPPEQQLEYDVGEYRIEDYGIEDYGIEDYGIDDDDNNQAQGYEDGGEFWDGQMTDIDPSLLMRVHELAYYDFPPSEASGSNSLPYVYEYGQ
ncbi:hypothetical protein Trco_007228 [Trichoderma cornu-damae]|uniref:Integrase zinc-binding domain-containing protein n=1 Tax=Trichoderma cornu-damae TaxID=654480 RepID=A0A9P8QJN5_9HYPO|nr:hypothetical protein Trco_007228 [Trichoderma cornu-damae]